ncbi:hypothetical protein N7471_001226 [Penicillium samsonianum]|uniref:uncharacterized protein n=1 Tax=Penicillium samsonianum TaxID=1882272 RepID=UPI002548C3CA|nr:uncharacterized protein N7471_001226 [Penicillium samsonianum]KAJ6150027.1 hypothetical protein N7471_001226 [Penicillium samsonianum]
MEYYSSSQYLVYIGILDFVNLGHSDVYVDLSRKFDSIFTAIIVTSSMARVYNWARPQQC